MLVLLVMKIFLAPTLSYHLVNAVLSALEDNLQKLSCPGNLLHQVPKENKEDQEMMADLDHQVHPDLQGLNQTLHH